MNKFINIIFNRKEQDVYTYSNLVTNFPENPLIFQVYLKFVKKS